MQHDTPATATASDEPTPPDKKSSNGVASSPPPAPGSSDSEWARTEPSDKSMGLVKLTLDKGVRTTAIGQLYGLDFEIDGDGYSVRLFFDNYNKRLKVLDYEADDYRAMVARVDYLADANGFDKVFFKARGNDWQRFLSFGYQLEGILKYFYRGKDGYVMSKFRSVERAHNKLIIEENELIEKLMSRPPEAVAKPLPPEYQLIECTQDHIPGLVELYRDVFATYPSPLTIPDFIDQTMKRNVLYRAILNGQGLIVAAASAEIDHKHSSAELTDCATLKSERGNGLMYRLLAKLIDDLDKIEIMTPFTLARAASFGMNLVFHRLGFEFTGRLVNNCDIYGQFEDMNIWVRRPEGTVDEV
jgi:putative beta-lysine N-acetyltransferase